MQMEQQHLNNCEGPCLKENGHRGHSSAPPSAEKVKVCNDPNASKTPARDISALDVHRSSSGDHESKDSRDEPRAQLGNSARHNSSEDRQLPNEKIIDKKLKIKHHKKCSGCLKKHLNKDVVLCGNCPKSYHRGCLSMPVTKNSELFLCVGCQQVLRQRQLKKSLKKQGGAPRQLQLFKMPKTEERPNRRIIQIDDHSPSVSKELEDFENRFPLYIDNGKIQFPIDDLLLQQYSKIMPKSLSTPKPSPSHVLQPWFGTVLETWNTLQTFQDSFKETWCVDVFSLRQVLRCQQPLVAVQNLCLDLLNFVCKDLFNERFQANRALVTNPFLYLLKYCAEIGALQRILKYAWVELLAHLINLNDFQFMFNNPHFNSLLNTLRNQSNQLWMPTNVNQRLLILQSLLDGIIETNSYHDDLYLKIERGRENTRLKNGALESIKELDLSLKDLLERKKVLNRELKDKMKESNFASDMTKYAKTLQKLQSEQRKLEDEEESIRDSINTERENISSASDNVSYANIEFMGKDKEERDYWFVLNQQDKLFVSEKSGDWFYYDIPAINELSKTLNPKGVRERSLLESLQTYRRRSYFGELRATESQLPRVIAQHAQFQANLNDYRSNNEEVDFDRESFISFEFVRKLLMLGEKKIFHYLDEKNARWGTTEDREAYALRVTSSTTNRQMIEAARFLNEKICVVEIEYGQMDEEGKESLDTNKMRKVQTKMWGINEKYKHAWLQYLATCDENSLIEVFFLVAILFLTIERYVSKMRETKRGRKDLTDEPQNTRENRILNKRNGGDNKKQNTFDWEQTCNACKQFGDLLCCDLCPKVYHLSCIGLSEIPEGNFQCKECESKRHTRSITKKIKEAPKP